MREPSGVEGVAPERGRRLIVANWKMNKTRAEALEFRDGFVPEAALRHVEIAIAPPYPFLTDLVSPDGRWSLAGQDCSAEPRGAFTGEVSAEMLASCGCRYVIVGHSERRKHFHESGALLAAKLARAREAGLVPIFCIGETLEERREGLTREVLRRQVESTESHPSSSPLVVAYEPVWAIGTGQNATPEQAEESIAHIRALLPGRPDLMVLYGGSVTADNAGELASREGISGFLVGGASLDRIGFARICRSRS
jgi:triosephosphate isomerase